MTQNSLSNHVEDLGDGLFCVRFSGTVGVGSEGNEHGKQMTNVIDGVKAKFAPTHLVIDFQEVNYRFGDWIAEPVLLARKHFGDGRVCVIAAGDTEKALSTLWALGPKWLVPLVTDLNKAYAYFNITPPQP